MPRRTRSAGHPPGTAASARPSGACRNAFYETVAEGCYHEHWLASSPLDAARRAVSHAQERGLKLDRLKVSSMVQPEDSRRGGLVYVVNDTRTYAVEGGRVRRAVRLMGPAPDSSTNVPEATADHRGEQFPPIRRSSRM